MTKGPLSGFPPVSRDDTLKLGDHRIILIRDPENEGHKYNRREHRLLPLWEKAYNVDQSWHGISGLLNGYLRALITVFSKYPHGGKASIDQTVCQFDMLGFRRRTCYADASRDYVAAVSEMISHGYRELNFFIRPVESSNFDLAYPFHMDYETLYLFQSKKRRLNDEDLDFGRTSKRQRTDENGTCELCEVRSEACPECGLSHKEGVEPVCQNSQDVNHSDEDTKWMEPSNDSPDGDQLEYGYSDRGDARYKSSEGDGLSDMSSEAGGIINYEPLAHEQDEQDAMEQRQHAIKEYLSTSSRVLPTY